MKKILILLIFVTSLLLILISCNQKTDKTEGKTEGVKTETQAPSTKSENVTTPENTLTLGSKKKISITPIPFEETVDWNDSKIGKISVYYPDLSSDTISNDVCTKIESSLRVIIDKKIGYYKAKLDVYAADYDPSDPFFYEYSIAFEPFFSEDLVSFKLLYNEDYGFESSDDAAAFVYSLKDGEEMTIDSLGYNKEVLCEEAIDRSLSMKTDFSEDYKETIRRIVCNSFYIDDKEIVLLYKPYEIAPGMAGVVEIRVSTENL